jgi:hypothetical protein
MPRLDDANGAARRTGASVRPPSPQHEMSAYKRQTSVAYCFMPKSFLLLFSKKKRFLLFFFEKKNQKTFA